MPAYQDTVNLKRQQAASLVKERKDREELARTVVDSITDKGIRVVAELDTTKATKTQLESLEKLRSVISQLKDSEHTANDELKSLVRDLIASVKALEMAPQVSVPAPTVNIPEQKAPKVTVDVDLDPLEATLRELLTPPEARLDLSSYRAQDIKEDGDTQYVGFVNPEGKWYIIENQTKKNQLRYVFGSKDYATHFKKAGSYVYRLLNEAINNEV